MAPETAALAAAVSSGNLAAAQRDWLTAHLQYETLGAAYGAFGNFDDEIDGRADAVGGCTARSGPASTGWSTGCGTGSRAARAHRGGHRSTHDVRRAAAVVADRRSHAARPRAAHPRGPRERARVPAHRARRLRQRHHPRDHGRHHQRQPGAARPAAPAARTRYPGLPAVYTGLDQLQALLDKERRPTAGGYPIGAVGLRPAGDRRRLRARSLQELAPIAAITEPRNSINAF